MNKTKHLIAVALAVFLVAAAFLAVASVARADPSAAVHYPKGR